MHSARTKQQPAAENAHIRSPKARDQIDLVRDVNSYGNLTPPNHSPKQPIPAPLSDSAPDSPHPPAHPPRAEGLLLANTAAHHSCTPTDTSAADQTAGGRARGASRDPPNTPPQ